MSNSFRFVFEELRFNTKIVGTDSASLVMAYGLYLSISVFVKA